MGRPGLAANSETLVFAVGEANGPEARFAARLATVLKNNSSRLRLKIVPNGDNAKALSQFDRKEANLAMLRTDARIPPRARALAILEHDLLLLISPGGKKIKTIAELKKKKIAVMADSESSAPWSANSRTLRHPGRGGAGPDGAAGLDLRQAVRLGLRRRDQGRACLADREGQELRAIGQARRLHPERDRFGEGDRQEIPGHFRGNGGDRHAVRLARGP